MDATFKGSPFWQETRTGLFVIEDYNWKRILNGLLDILDVNIAAEKLQSIHQLMNANFTGSSLVRGHRKEAKPNTENLGQGLPPEGFYNLECMFLEWLFCYYIVESICATFPSKPYGEWAPSMQQTLERFLHHMVVFAAIMVELEAGKLKNGISKDNFGDVKHLVEFHIKKITETLLSKTHDYGESFRRHGIQGTVPRIWDKAARYVQLSALGRSANYEPKADALKDLLGYCVIAWSLALDAVAVDTEEEANAVHQGS